ncbi:MAG: metallophosphoesterase [Acidobacteria bacterium]|nr:metallophosphoesterase [Acidobacteriota bacterium]MBI3662546.1 metallophosphoesterase [Acidobacteriota bacterium]
MRHWDRLVERWSRDFGSSFVEDYSFAGAERHRALHRRVYDGRIEVTEHRIRLHNLPENFRGLRIVQLSDIHHSLFLPFHAVLDAVSLANRLKPDVIALTGDFVTYSRAYIEPVAAILGTLRARHGVFAVLGNHDFRVDAGEVTRALERHAIEVLRNRHTLIRHAGHSLPIAGIDDLGYSADLSRALHGIRPGAPSILLSHNPKIIRRAAHCQVSLVLSGHTHGGQINLPFAGTVFGRSPERMRFKSGWDRLGPTQIYVSRGIGTVVLPLRVRCPAEIPHFHLQPYDSSRAAPHRLSAES